MTTEEKSPWELESGLPNDVDAYMVNCRFGTREQYLEQVMASGGEAGGVLMFLCDLVDEGGEVLGQGGWSVGSGWKTEDEGASIAHPTRKNVVVSSRYGQLQHRVVKELAVDMNKFGRPTVASSWNGLGFHWMMEEHETLKEIEGKRERKPGLMPTAFVGVLEVLKAGAPAAKAAAAPKIEVPADLEMKLTELAQTSSIKDFQVAALKTPGVATNDNLLASIMDDGPTGFFATHQK